MTPRCAARGLRVLLVAAVCATGLACCVPAAEPRPCAADVDCPGAYVCAAQLCDVGPPCAADDDCAISQRCVDDRCARAGAAPDAGTSSWREGGPQEDAGDAGRPADGGAADGGLDAGAVDAGAARDGGVAADAGTVDAGALDAGAPCVVDGGCAARFSFTPRLAVRRAGGGFDHGLILQGDGTRTDAATGDRIVLPTGDVVAGSFTAYADPRQGTALVWLRPEWSSLAPPQGELLLFEVAGLRVTLLPSAGRARVRLPDDTYFDLDDASTDWSAGEPRFFALRWDARRPIFGAAGASPFGSHHLALTVDDVTTTFGDAPFASGQVVSQSLGAFADGTGPLNGQLTGLTVYRRPLSNASGGVRLSAEDELDRVVAALGVDSTTVTGPWDVVLGVPTSQREGVAVAAGNAWTAPHLSNLVDGFDLVSAIGGGWQLSDATSVQPLASAEDELFGGAVRIESDGDAPAVVSSTFALPATRSVVARVLTHAVFGGDASVTLGCAGEAPAVSLDGTSTSSAVAPDELVLTFQALPACDQAELRVVAPAGGALVFHQAEVYENLVTNPSFERFDGGVFEGWQKPSSQASDALFSAAFSDVRSGNVSLSIVGEPGTGFAHLLQDVAAEQGAYYGVGGSFSWRSGGAVGVMVDDGALFAQARASSPAAANRLSANASSISGWQQIAAVGRRDLSADLDANDDRVRWGRTTVAASADALVDDAWMIALPSVGLTLAPASLQRSTAAGWVRLDGRDAAVQRLAQLPGTGAGVTLRARLGRPHGTTVAACEPPFVIARLRFDDGDAISLLEEPEGLTLFVTVDGTTSSDTLAGVAAARGAAQDVTVSWDGAQVRAAIGSSQLSVVAAAAVIGSGSADLDLADGRCDRQILLPGATVTGQIP